MRIPKRFTLSALFLLTTALTLFLGYAQWQRLVMVKEVRFLQEYGVEGISVSDDWLWPTVPRTVVIREVVMPPESFSSAIETIRLYEELTARLNRIGATDLSYEVTLLDRPSPRIVTMKDVDELREHLPAKQEAKLLSDP